jgi:hypothetical protein
MPQRNGPRSHRGRSAVARKVLTSAGSSNGMMSQKEFTASDGTVHKGYFGGMKKGGSAPSATGFMIPSGRGNVIATAATKSNFLFRFKTGPGGSPYGYGPHA